MPRGAKAGEGRPNTVMGRKEQLRREYEADNRVTVYTLALRYGCHVSTVHRALVAAGTKMRPSGGDKKSKNTRGLLGWLYN